MLETCILYCVYVVSSNWYDISPIGINHIIFKSMKKKKKKKKKKKRHGCPNCKQSNNYLYTAFTNKNKKTIHIKTQ